MRRHKKRWTDQIKSQRARRRKRISSWQHVTINKQEKRQRTKEVGIHKKCQIVRKQTAINIGYKFTFSVKYILMGSSKPLRVTRQVPLCLTYISLRYTKRDVNKY
jgi:hypothetical protein